MTTIAIPQVNQAKLQIFLNQVVAGQQDEAISLLKQHPELALGAGTVTDHANRTFHNITGFQYAIWALDWHMWRMIKKYLSPEEANLQAEGFAMGSWVKEHGEHVTWKRLIENYHTLIANWDSWYKSSNHSYKKVNQYWVEEIGGAQLLLPIHVIQEYCQPNRLFEPALNFKEDIILTRSLPTWLTLQNLGIPDGFALIRAWYNVMAVCAHDVGNTLETGLLVIVAIHDAEAISQLYDIRVQQRQELLAELKANLKSFKLTKNTEYFPTYIP
jgi:hypothetical protein